MSPRISSMCTPLALSLIVILLLINPANSWGGKKVKLKDVEVLTLRHGQYTTGRRSSPVPQLKCLGGSAGCQDPPAVVQCYNRGSDGYSTQWECKADMSQSQKFGTVEVTCEGYDYADDDYILAGSCGLEYRLEKTGYGPGSSWKHSAYTSHSKSGSTFQTILFLGVAAFIIFVIYRNCLAPGQLNDGPPGYDDDPPPDYPGSPRGGFFGGGGGGGGTPPPPGFRPQYQTGAGCGSARGFGPAGGLGGGGFWTGAAAGGLLGYLMGNRNNAGYRTAYGYPSEGTFGSSSSFGSPSSFGGPSTSSGTHSSSGFGGTRRR
ncbi:store-operated calcium entry-associated regulatory factor-like [Dermacentor variabilis]|uniref:store-operated calcium entry-associated regulatory factor-like n=1 Tax=Dermacentor variabilis TaxID=34621 RepID=UPI003F5B30FB